MEIFKIEEIKNKNILGRTVLIQSGKKENQKGLHLFWTLSGIELNVRASELWAEFAADFSTHEPWISVWIDGAETSRLMLNKGKNKVCIFRGLNPSVAKKVQIYKETQAMSEDKNHSLVLKSFSSDGTFLPVQRADKKIEFIGDSITSGEGSIGARGENDWASIWFGGTKTYAFKLAKLLNAEPRVISQSGWGVVTGYDNNPNKALPLYYEQICGVQRGASAKNSAAQESYDFKKWQPDYVVINLGTNDQGAFNHPAFQTDDGNIYKMHLEKSGAPRKEDALLFQAAVTEFLKNVRAHNPKAKIVWTCGMFGYLLWPQISQGFKEYKQATADENCLLIKLPELDYAKTGALGHPSEAQHEAAARFLYSKIRDSN